MTMIYDMMKVMTMMSVVMCDDDDVGCDDDDI